MDLEQFLAALDEDERVALAAAEAEAYITLTLKATHLDGDEGAQALVEHYRRHRPADTLRWVKAAREILDSYESAELGAEAAGGTALAGAARLRRETLFLAVRALASVYGDTGEAG